MFKNLTADDIYSHYLMLKSGDDKKRVVLLVEGESDYSALDGHIDEQHVNIIPSFGKKNIEGAMEIAHIQNEQRLVAILDRDWVGYIDERSDNGNVFYTDYYDLDATVFFSSDAPERVAKSYSTVAKVRGKVESLGVSSITEACAKISFSIGAARYLSTRDRIGINTDNFPLEQVIEEGSIEVDHSKLIEIAIRKSKKVPAIQKNTLIEAVIDFKGSCTEPHQYCSGHDLARSLSAIIRSTGARVSFDTVEKSLRAAFHYQALSKTQIFQELLSWSNKNKVKFWGKIDSAEPSLVSE